MGIAELAKGNYITAEAHFKKALKSNPRDIDALIGAGILYQNTGQLTKAREMYEAVLALRPDDSKQFVVWSDITTRPASQIASVNLSLLDSGGATAGAQNPTALTAPAGPVRGAPAGSAMLGRTAVPSAPSPNMASASPMAPEGTMAPMAGDAGMGFSGADANVMSRYSTLKALRDQGLITPNEPAPGARPNIGAMLPLTSPPPAAGLDRPVPTTEQIAGRLRAIGRALEMRAISVAQHSAERNMILDALMPSVPVVVANPAVPPRGLMEAADSVRRLEKLKNEGFITSDEYARERQAIELAMRPAQPAPAAMAAQPVSKPMAMEKEAAAKAERRRRWGRNPPCTWPLTSRRSRPSAVGRNCVAPTAPCWVSSTTKCSGSSSAARACSSASRPGRSPTPARPSPPAPSSSAAANSASRV